MSSFQSYRSRDTGIAGREQGVFVELVGSFVIDEEFEQIEQSVLSDEFQRKGFVFAS